MEVDSRLTTGRASQPSTRQLKRKEIRDRILQAAREVLAEQGFSLDMIELTHRAGVGSGTVYRYFGSKERLIQSVVEELVTKTDRELREIARTPGDARTDVKRTMRVGFTRVKEYGQLTITLMAGTQPRQYRDLVDRKELEQFFSHILRRGVEQCHFRRDLDIDYAVAVWFALVAPDALSRLLLKRSIEEVASSTTAFFLAGISR